MSSLEMPTPEQSTQPIPPTEPMAEQNSGMISVPTEFRHAVVDSNTPISISEEMRAEGARVEAAMKATKEAKEADDEKYWMDPMDLVPPSKVDDEMNNPPTLRSPSVGPESAPETVRSSGIREKTAGVGSAEGVGSESAPMSPRAEEIGSMSVRGTIKVKGSQEQQPFVPSVKEPPEEEVRKAA